VAHASHGPVLVCREDKTIEARANRSRTAHRVGGRLTNNSGHAGEESADHIVLELFGGEDFPLKHFLLHTSHRRVTTSLGKQRALMCIQGELDSNLHVLARVL